MSYFTDQTSLIDFYNVELNVSDLLSTERYQDRILISTGGVKEVYAVTDTHCARDVAFATIKNDVFDTRQALDFIREIQITSGFEHPNIIRVYDVGIENDRPWFTMELSSEKTLSDFIKNGTHLSLLERLEIFIQLCDAVQYAHERDVLHLDLKPANIAIGQQGQVLLADWGIASSMGDRPVADLIKSQSRYEYIKGSLGYMSPEQLTLDYKKVSTVDIFGLGGLFFFILTEESPILGEERKELEENTKAGVIKNLVRADIPERLVPLLTKVLAKNPQDRYQSVVALKADIVAFRNGFATSAESASVWQQLNLFCRRNKALVATMMVATGILLGFTGYYIYSIKGSESKARKAQLLAEREKQEANKARDETEEAHKEALSALVNYLQSERLREELNKEFAAILIDVTLEEISSFDFDKALIYSKKSVAKDPRNKRAQTRLATLYFIRQEFSNASIYFKKSGRRTVDTIKLANNFKNSQSPLSERDLKKVLHQIHSNSFLALCMLKYDATVRSVEGHSNIVAYFLNITTGMELEHFKYEEKSQTLDLSASSILQSLYVNTRHTIPINVISTLPIKKLILKDTVYNRQSVDRLFRPNTECEILFQ